jgi:hypothetical protein
MNGFTIGNGRTIGKKGFTSDGAIGTPIGRTITGFTSPVSGTPNGRTTCAEAVLAKMKISPRSMVAIMTFISQEYRHTVFSWILVFILNFLSGMHRCIIEPLLTKQPLGTILLFTPEKKDISGPV